LFLLLITAVTALPQETACQQEISTAINSNGLVVILPDIVSLKIANTDDKHPQTGISDYSSIFAVFLGAPLGRITKK
jgi:hypothetical protein